MSDTPGRSGVVHLLSVDGLTVGGLKAFLERLRVPDAAVVGLDLPAGARPGDDEPGIELFGFEYRRWDDGRCELTVVADLARAEADPDQETP